ncbi:hypothetical protein [Alkaliphilus serpentinus]|uniref:DUF443 family protein n=1 Tax=Alkaliphilus serpentinus TaxID=1482731 RepID=A0A833HNH5_9FIRM|nr:hypothetical protein [Alkaliphilus serpentinus]KAB3529582.1 hypothetical protein F8153_09000 [Alkaliphilus serpentinus]
MVGTTTYFRESSGDKYIFYPYGPLGAGLIIDENIKNTVQKFKKIYLAVISIFLLILLYYNGPCIYGLHIISAFFIGIIIGVLITRLITLKCEKSIVKLSFNERRQLILDNEKKEKNSGFVVVMISALLLLIISMSLLFNPGAKNIFLLIILIITTAFYAVMFVDSLILLKNKYF